MGVEDILEDIKKLSKVELRNILQKFWPEFLQELRVSGRLLDHLVAAGILDLNDRAEVQAKATNTDKVVKLLSHFWYGPEDWFLTFTNILFKINQGHVASILSRKSGLCVCIDVLRRQYRRYYESVTEFQEDNISLLINLQETFTNLAIRVNTAGLSGYEGEDESLIDIDDILDEKDRTVFIEGDPGQGKSCLILHMLQFWGEANSSEKVNPKLTSVLANYRLIIYISREDYRSCLGDTVWVALGNHATARDRPEAFNFWTCHKSKCALFFDSIDEAASDQGLIQELYDAMKMGEMLMIIGVRSSHTILQRLKRAPHKSIEVLGFSRLSILNFTIRYFAGGRFEQQGNKLRTLVLEDRHVEGLLHNPLALYLTCFLIVQDNLDVITLKMKTILDIFNDVENLYLRREGSALGRTELDTFHRFALYRLLNDERPHFFEADLCDFGITAQFRDLPFIVQRKRTDPRERIPGPALTWIHRSFHEYSAAKAVEEMTERKRKELFMFMAAERMLSGVARFMMSLLGRGDQLFGSLASVTLALQSNLPMPVTGECWTCQHHCRIRSLLLKESFLSDFLNGEKGQGLDKREVELALSPCDECLNRSGYLATDDGQCVLRNALQCIYLAPDDKQTEIYTQVIRKYLPTRRVVDLDGFIKSLYPVAKANRLIACYRKQDSTEVYLEATCVEDIITTPLPDPIHTDAPHSLWISLDAQECSLFSFFPPHPFPSKYTWSTFLNKISKITGEVRIVKLLLPVNTPLYPLLEAAEENVSDLTRNGMDKMEVWYGQVQLSDWNKWFYGFKMRRKEGSRFARLEFCATHIITSDTEQKTGGAGWLYRPRVEAKGIIQSTRI